jgi:uncharacterized LabA/DUF88 family protein
MTIAEPLIPSYVYVDGFNLYYGAVKGTKYKWLDICKLCRFLLPKNDIIRIKYFSAPVNARPNDPQQPIRQQVYFRALETNPNTEIILGRFLSHTVMMPIAHPNPGRPRFIDVVKTEEKGSDVNIATHLVNDAHLQRFQAAIIISNDSDLVEAIKIVHNDLHKVVIILNPFSENQSKELSDVATFVKPIRKGVLSVSQFPDSMTDQNGPFSKPSGW